ncbi:MAG: DUF4827 domain-containing protein [Prevotella sp.]|nr:DUF4827 domain-containing protein [Prevotella sp.]
MTKTKIIMLALGALLMLSACNDRETYAEMKEKERSAINQFIIDKGIKVISETDFKANGEVTNVANNEFVLFGSNGVYLQIVRKGCGEKIKSGESANVICRFLERNVLTDTLQLTNNSLYFASMPDVMQVNNTSGTFSASFVSGVMYSVYGASVPTGWLVPFPYINVGRPVNENDEIAKVKVIVPGEAGQQQASQYVYPCYYEITFERGI